MDRSLTRRSVLGLLALTAGAFTTAPTPGWSQALPVFRRGISVSNLFGWADVTADESYIDPPFGPSRFTPMLDQLRIIREAGFDFVRLVVDVGPFLAASPAHRDTLDTLLTTTVSAILDQGLGIIVDPHPSRMNPAYMPAKLTAGVSTPAFRAFTAFLTRTASRLKRLVASRGGRETRLALELMNEPEITPEAWTPMLQAAYRAARDAAPLLPLVVGGGSMNAADALASIDAASFAGDDRILYTFHDYQPWQFTHQGLLGNPAYVFDGVPYPAPASPDAMIAATDRRIDGLSLGIVRAAAARLESRRALDSYVRSGFDRTVMSRTFDDVDAWRKTRGLPAHAILLGEFGAHLTPYMRTQEGIASRLAWLRDMRELAEAHGFAWACWTYVGVGGFAIADREIGPGFDAGTRQALGLTSGP